MQREWHEGDEMVGDSQTLEEKVDELVQTIHRLEDELTVYQRRISLMMVCKLTDPRHPYTDWELIHLHTENEQKRFRAVMTALQNRLEGKMTPVEEQIDVGVVPTEVLYARSTPSLSEVVDILKNVGRQTDASLIEVMNALTIEFESEFGVLAHFVLDGVRIAEETP